MIGRHGKGVAALVLGVPGVPFDPVEADVVVLVDGVEAEPEVGVFLLGESGPDPLLEPPFGEGLHHVGGVAVYLYLGAFPADCLEPDDDGQELHPVVGREAEALAELLLVAAAANDHAVPARAGIAAGGTVGE